MTRRHKWEPDRSKQRLYEARYILKCALISAVIAALLEYWKTDPGAKFAWSDYFANAMVVFFIGELYPILSASLRAEAMHRQMMHAIEQATLKHRVNSQFNQILLKIFEHHGNPAFDAATQALGKFVRKISVNDHSISLRGDYLARELYEAFWDEVLKLQSVEGDGAPITVFATHASAVRVWLSNRFASIRDKQVKFVARGGRIFRIVFNEAHNRETEEDYARVIDHMRDMGVKAFYLDRRQSVDHVDSDYLLVSAGGHHFVLIWYIGNGNEGSFGNLAGTKITIGEEEFHDLWREWKGVVDELCATTPSATHRALAVKPNEHERDVMKTLYDE